MGDYVYIIAHEESGGAVGPVKVGVASDPRTRLKGLQTGNPRPLVLAAIFGTPNRSIALALETAFHEVMADHRLSGEWFNLAPERASVAMRINLEMALRVHTGLPDDEIQQMMDLSYEERPDK